MALDYADKVRKLLAKAESTDSKHEAEALTAQAFKLIQQHDIDEANLTATGQTTADEPIIVRYVACHGIFNEVLVSLGHAVAASLRGVQSIRDGSGTRSQMIFVGYESKVQLVETLFASLTLQQAGALKRRWKDMSPFMIASTSMEKFKWKRSFGLGFAYEVRTRFEQLRKEADVEVSDSTAIVLYDKDKKIDQYVEDAFKVKMVSKRLSSDFGAQYLGRKDGALADLGQGGVEGNSHTALK